MEKISISYAAAESKKKKEKIGDSINYIDIYVVIVVNKKRIQI